MDRKKKITIVTPSYNQGVFIKDTLLSVYEQDYENIEHIVVDGNSTDNTKDLLREFESIAKDREGYSFKWYSEEDNGQAHAVNKGISRAEGDIIGWLNSDDMYVKTNTLSVVHREFKKGSNEVLYGDKIIVNRNGVTQMVDQKPKFSTKLLMSKCFICQPTVFLTSRVAKKNKINEKMRYVMDYEWWIRLSKQYKFKHISEVVAADREHNDRKMSKNKSQLREERRQMKQKFDNSIDQKIHRAVDYIGNIMRRVKNISTMSSLEKEGSLVTPITTKKGIAAIISQLKSYRRK